MRNGLIHTDRLAERHPYFGVLGPDLHSFPGQPDQRGGPEHTDVVKGPRELGPRRLAIGERTAGGGVPPRQRQAAEVAVRDRRLPVRSGHVKHGFTVESQHRVGDRSVDEKLVAHGSTARCQRHNVRSGEHGPQQLFFAEATQEDGPRPRSPRSESGLDDGPPPQRSTPIPAGRRPRRRDPMGCRSPTPRPGRSSATRPYPCRSIRPSEPAAVSTPCEIARRRLANRALLIVRRRSTSGSSHTRAVASTLFSTELIHAKK